MVDAHLVPDDLRISPLSASGFRPTAKQTGFVFAGGQDTPESCVTPAGAFSSAQTFPPSLVTSIGSTPPPTATQSEVDEHEIARGRPMPDGMAAVAHEVPPLVL